MYVRETHGSQRCTQEFYLTLRERRVGGGEHGQGKEHRGEAGSPRAAGARLGVARRPLTRRCAE